MRNSVIAAALLVASSVVPAAAQAPAAAAREDQNAWVKICNRDEQSNKDLCLVTQELRTNSGQFLASMAIRETPGEARKTLLVSIPNGMLIQQAVAVQIDGGNPEKANYQICFPNACYAEKAIDAAFITRMKAGGKLQLTTFNQQGKPVRFEMTLIGFTAAYDGPGINPQELAEQQQSLQRELEQRAADARNRLVAEQRRAVDEAQAQAQ